MEYFAVVFIFLLPHICCILPTRDERVQHYLYLLTIWIICICICTRTGRGLTRKWAGFNLEVGRVVLKWTGLYVMLFMVCYFKHAIDLGWSEIVIFIAD